MCYYLLMDGRAFTRRARKYARKNRLDFIFDPSKGKGSHGKLTVGNRHTIVQQGEIPPGTLAAMLRQLNIDRREF